MRSKWRFQKPVKLAKSTTRLRASVTVEQNRGAAKARLRRLAVAVGATPACRRSVGGLRAVVLEAAIRARGVARVRDDLVDRMRRRQAAAKSQLPGRRRCRRGAAVALAAPDHVSATRRAVRLELGLRSSAGGDGRVGRGLDRCHKRKLPVLELSRDGFANPQLN